MNQENLNVGQAEPSLTSIPEGEEKVMKGINENRQLLAQIIDTDSENRDLAIDKLIGKKITGHDIAKALEPMQRSKQEMDLPVITIADNTKKVIDLCTVLLASKDPRAKKLITKINSFLADSGRLAIDKHRVWSNDKLTKQQKKEKRYSGPDEPYGLANLRQIITFVAEKTGKVPFTADLIIKSQVEPQKIIGELSPEQKRQIINSVTFPFQNTYAPDKFLRESGLRRVLAREWVSTFLEPLVLDSDESTEEEIAETFKEMFQKKNQESIKFSIIILTQIVLESKELELSAKKWQQLLNNADQMVEIQEIDVNQWRIKFPDGTTNIIEPEGTKER